MIILLFCCTVAPVEDTEKKKKKKKDDSDTADVMEIFLAPEKEPEAVELPPKKSEPSPEIIPSNHINFTLPPSGAFSGYYCNSPLQITQCFFTE